MGSDEVVEFTLTVRDGTATVSDSMLVAIQDSANAAPSVNAGDDTGCTAAEGSTVNLDGTAADADTEDTLTYSWTHNSTLTVTLDDDTALDTFFTAPNVGSDEVVEFTLTVRDGTATVSDSMLVAIQDSANAAPSVNAGDDQDAAEGSTVNLDGTAADADTEDTLTYSWTHNSTLTVTLDDRNAEDPEFTVPNVAEDTAVEFTLAVSDGTATVSDKVIVTITDSEIILQDPFMVNITADSPTNTSPIIFQIVFENVIKPATFTASDIMVTNGIVSGIENTEDRMTFTFGIIPAMDGNVTASIDDGVVQDTLDNQNLPASHTVISDRTPPVLTLPEDAITEVGQNEPYGIPSATCVDELDSTPAVSHVGSVDTAVLGEYTIVYTCADNVGNLAVDDLIVTVIPQVVNPAAPDDDDRNIPPVVDLRTLWTLPWVTLPQEAKDALLSYDKFTPLEPVHDESTFDYPLRINGDGYALGGWLNTLKPPEVIAGEPTIIEFTAYEFTEIIHFTMYLNLHDNQISYVESDTHVVYDDGNVTITDPHDYISRASVTIENDKEQWYKKTIRTVVAFNGGDDHAGMGMTNMIVRMWDSDIGPTNILVLDALNVVTGIVSESAAVPEPGTEHVDPEPGTEHVDPEPGTEHVDPEPGTEHVDPEPGTEHVDPDPGVVDPEPTAMLATVDPEPASQDSADRPLLAIRMWSGFEPGSVTDAQLLAVLGLDYPGVDIPGWVMTELGPLVAKGEVTVDEFRTALEYVLEMR